MTPSNKLMIEWSFNVLWMIFYNSVKDSRQW